MITRLVSVGNVIIDIVAEVPELPERGGDVLASRGMLEVGGGFNLMAAAARQGMEVAYAGALGHGPFGDLARRALQAEGIAALLPAADEQRDTGFDIVLVEASGERTFVTAVGAEAGVTCQRLDHVEIRPTDALAISGYGLLHEANRQAILKRLRRLSPETTVCYDPGPLGHTLPDQVVDVVRQRVDWWSCNEREASLATSRANATEAALALLARLPRGSVVVRMGMSGCLVAQPGTGVLHVPGEPVTLVDTTGAGDAHFGAYIAGLAAGRDAQAAARRANVVAALTVTRRGPATSPTADETDRFLTGS
ncbi:MAG TPA: PfkB family carbohydrate kinase [Propionibacteriaceae bacterium]|nr:PfkB family carbohydrate kinase [Propionibacteriaceae bacterium]